MIDTFRIRCSSLGTLMTDPRSIDPALLDETTAPVAAKKSKTEADHALLAPLFDASLSAGAKTYLNEIAKEYVYGYHDVVSSKYTLKGTIVENESIHLYNELYGTDYRKNTERRQNDWISGECDICTGTRIIDIKSSWSLKTFPEVEADGHDNGYEWQVRGYMWLWDVEEAEVAYCMVDTPGELIGYENPEMHEIDARDPPLPLPLRVTRVRYTRDRALEARITRRVEAARRYLAARIERITLEHPQ